MLSPDNSPTANTIDAWLAVAGKPWAERVREMYGDSAEDVLEMVLGGAA